MKTGYMTSRNVSLRSKIVRLALVFVIVLFGSVLICAYEAVQIERTIVPFSPDIVVEQESQIIASFFGIRRNLARDIYTVSKSEGVDPFLFASLVYTESNFDLKAVSSKGYKGLAQIPYYVPPKYTKANLVVGAHIFKEKLEETKGDVYEAIRLYKGYPKHDPKGHKQVNKVLETRVKLVNYKINMQGR